MSAHDAPELALPRPVPIHYGRSGFVFWGGKIYIDASKPGADALAKDYPDCPAVNALTLAMLDRLTHENATLEAKVALLKAAIADL